MQMVSINSCLHSAYSIAFIGIAESQEVVPFFIALFVCFVPEEPGPQVVDHSDCSMLCPSVIIFCFSININK